MFENKKSIYMTKQILKSLFFVLVFTSFSTYAESINERAFKTSIKASCSVNEKTYKECFNLNQDQCYKLLTDLIPKCSKNKYVFPLKQSEAPQLAACLNVKFEEELVSRGINLDAPCSK